MANIELKFLKSLQYSRKTQKHNNINLVRLHCAVNWNTTPNIASYYTEGRLINPLRNHWKTGLVEKGYKNEKSKPVQLTLYMHTTEIKYYCSE